MHRISSIAFPSFAAICGFAVAQADAAVIGIDDFSGNETVITFEDHFTARPSVTIGDVAIDTLTVGSDISVKGTDWGVLFADISEKSGNPAATVDGSFHQFRITFGTGVRRAGLLLATSPIYTWHVAAYDSDGDLIEAAEFGTEEMNKAVFAGFEVANAEIAWLEIGEIDSKLWVTVIDDIRFEAVPEPASLFLLACGAMAVSSGRFRSRTSG